MSSLVAAVAGGSPCAALSNGPCVVLLLSGAALFLGLALYALLRVPRDLDLDSDY